LKTPLKTIPPNVIWLSSSKSSTFHTIAKGINLCVSSRYGHSHLCLWGIYSVVLEEPKN